MRAWILALSLVAAGCGRAKDPTPKGTKLVEWDRSTAKLHDLKDLAKEGPKHPIADAKIVEGPKTASYTVTVKDMSDKTFSYDVEFDSAKVSYMEDGKEIVKWATTRIDITLAQNDAFRIVGSCDDRVAMVLGKPGEHTNTMMDCRVTGKRPNDFGDEDAITVGAYMQFEGSGKLLMNDPNVEIKER